MKPARHGLKRKTWVTGPQTAIGCLGERRVKSVSLPRLDFLAEPIDITEAAERFATARVVRQGRDAWEAIDKAQSFESWKSIGAALSVGKTHALRTTGANRAWGQHYSREFGKWLKEHGFDQMPKSTRSVAIELHENAKAIEVWRATLPERQRRRLVHPLSNVRRWRHSTETSASSKGDRRARRRSAPLATLPSGRRSHGTRGGGTAVEHRGSRD